MSSWTFIPPKNTDVPLLKFKNDEVKHPKSRAKNHKIGRILCCVKRKDIHLGCHFCGATCGSHRDCCTTNGCVTCSLSHGGRLWISFTVAFCWIFIGSLLVYTLEPESFRYDFGTAIYFAVITSATIGYGDYTLKTTTGRIFLFFWAHVSIITFAIFGAFLAREIQSCLAIKPREGQNTIFNHYRFIVYKYQPLVIIFVYICILFFGALIFQHGPAYVYDKIGSPDSFNVTEWTFEQSFYYSWVTATTIGYGDNLTKNHVGQFLTVGFAIFGISMVALLLAQANSLACYLQAKLVKRRRFLGGRTLILKKEIPPQLPKYMYSLLKQTLTSIYDMEPPERKIFMTNLTKIYTNVLEGREDQIRVAMDVLDETGVNLSTSEKGENGEYGSLSDTKKQDIDLFQAIMEPKNPL